MKDRNGWRQLRMAWAQKCNAPPAGARRRHPLYARDREQAVHILRRHYTCGLTAPASGNEGFPAVIEEIRLGVAILPRALRMLGTGSPQACHRLPTGLLLRYCSGITLTWIAIHIRVIPEQHRSNTGAGRGCPGSRAAGQGAGCAAASRAPRWAHHKLLISSDLEMHA